MGGQLRRLSPHYVGPTNKKGWDMPGLLYWCLIAISP